jgi:hypothetical protein
LSKDFKEKRKKAFQAEEITCAKAMRLKNHALKNIPETSVPIASE